MKKIDRLTRFLEDRKGKAYEPTDRIKEYFETYNSEDGVFLFAREKTDVIERGIALCGYFCIITSKQMTAKEALELYKGRDASEKLFRGITPIWGMGVFAYIRMNLYLPRCS